MTHNSAEYLMLQYVRDPLRREGMNVGVVVRKGGQYAARFFGEENGVLDGRRIRAMAAPDVYREWVAYWRRSLRDADPFESILKARRENYHAFLGGEIYDTHGDSPDKVADYLFSVLVADGGLREVLADAEAEEAVSVAAGSGRLDRQLTDAFKRVSILAAGDQELALVKYPIRHRAEVAGTLAIPHQPEFSQRNGKLIVIESVDFTVSRGEYAKNHAGLAAFMFSDLRAADREQVETIAVVKRPEVRGNDHVFDYGMSMLQKESTQVVDWATEGDRFIEERRLVAVGAME